MKRDCPTIQELLAFDAVARYESVSKAAEVLCLTVSAVSKQLAGLELFMGRRLLEKRGRGVQLTPLGQFYWQKIATSLRMIEAATFEVRSNVADSGVLSLACVPTFLTKWLIPRLPDFRRAHPSITLSFSQHMGLSEPLAPGVDVVIRYGTGEWPGLVADYIAGREFVLVVSPTLQGLGNRMMRPADLLGHTLLHHEEAPQAWPLWSEQQGLTQLHVHSGPRFAQYSAVIQAAISGLGVALVPRVLVEEELEPGSLLCPFDQTLVVGQGHFLCYRPDRAASPLLAAFKGWILAQHRA